MSENDEHWISTQYKQKFHFLNPTVEEIGIKDIAHALSNTCRFGGHCRSFYSVAEHCLHVSSILRELGADKVTQLAGLLHDAEEAYLLDIPAPMKSDMPELDNLHEGLQALILTKYGAQGADWELVKDIDHRLCITEAKALGLWNKDWAPTGEPLSCIFNLWPPRSCEQLFLSRYRELGGEV